MYFENGCNHYWPTSVIVVIYYRNYLRTRKAESPEEEPIDYNSIYVKSFNKPEFVPTFPEPTRVRVYRIDS